MTRSRVSERVSLPWLLLPPLALLVWEAFDLAVDLGCFCNEREDFLAMGGSPGKKVCVCGGACRGHPARVGDAPEDP